MPATHKGNTLSEWREVYRSLDADDRADAAVAFHMLDSISDVIMALDDKDTDVLAEAASGFDTLAQKIEVDESFHTAEKRLSELVRHQNDEVSKWSIIALSRIGLTTTDVIPVLSGIKSYWRKTNDVVFPDSAVKRLLISLGPDIVPTLREWCDAECASSNEIKIKLCINSVIDELS